MYDPAPDRARVEHATASLVDTARRLGADDLRASSRLPNWTRAHVLAHVCGNADSLVNLLTWARTGVETPAYVSAEARTAAIEAGSSRTPDEHLAELEASAARFAAAVDAMPAERWDEQVRWRSGGPQPASLVLWARLREVEVHHVDLALDYTPAHWHADFTSRALAETARMFGRRDDVEAMRLEAVDTGDAYEVGSPDVSGPIVDGPSAALLAWLIGRTSGDGLQIVPHDRALPELPTWM